MRARVEEGWRGGATGGSARCVSAPRSINVAVSRTVARGDVLNPAASFSKAAAPVARTHACSHLCSECVCVFADDRVCVCC